MIVIYDDPEARTAAATLLPQLRRSFPQESLMAANTADFLAALRGGAGTIAVIPGITGERSSYYDLLGGDQGMKDIENFVRRGGILVTLCAGSYLVARKTEYIPPWGAAKERTNASPLFNAVARGPLAGLGQMPAGDAWYDDVAVASVSCKMPDGKWKRTGMAYGNGPALFLDNPDPEAEILARFDDVPGAPAAAAWKTIGHGAILWLGVLPYIGHDPLQQHTGLPRLDNLQKNLKPHEQDRRSFWDGLIRRIQNHKNLHQTPRPDNPMP